MLLTHAKLLDCTRRLVALADADARARAAVQLLVAREGTAALLSGSPRRMLAAFKRVAPPTRTDALPGTERDMQVFLDSVPRTGAGVPAGGELIRSEMLQKARELVDRQLEAFWAQLTAHMRRAEEPDGFIADTVEALLDKEARVRVVKCGRAECDRVVVQEYGTGPRGNKSTHCHGHALTTGERSKRARAG